MAGAAGIEPAPKVLETSVIPFYYAPVMSKNLYHEFTPYPIESLHLVSLHTY
jgi:hypothetical protein